MILVETIRRVLELLYENNREHPGKGMERFAVYAELGLVQMTQIVWALDYLDEYGYVEVLPGKTADTVFHGSDYQYVNISEKGIQAMENPDELEKKFPRSRHGT
jgi:hypothetical protein